MTIQVADRFRERYVNVGAMVDTGSTYTSLPESMLEDLGIEREETDVFKLADNRLVEYSMGETRVRLEGRELTVPVIFAANDSTPTVGRITLAILGLGMDQVEQKLVRVNSLRKKCTLAQLLE